jgi:hypothetical protein
MTDIDSERSVVLAADFRGDDPEQMWLLLKERRANMADIGAHHVVVYMSLRSPG